MRERVSAAVAPSLRFPCRQPGLPPVSVGGRRNVSEGEDGNGYVCEGGNVSVGWGLGEQGVVLWMMLVGVHNMPLGLMVRRAGVQRGVGI